MSNKKSLFIDAGLAKKNHFRLVLADLCQVGDQVLNDLFQIHSCMVLSEKLGLDLIPFYSILLMFRVTA